MLVAGSCKIGGFEPLPRRPFMPRMNREQDDDAHNEVDGEEAIKLYDELVKSPEDRLVLEKEIPSLIGRARQSGHGRKTETTPERKGRPNAKCLPEIGGASASN